MKTPYYKYIDSIHNLSEQDREWYKKFILAYYYQSTKAMDELDMPRDMRRELYNNHRAVKADVMNKCDLIYLEDMYD